MEDKRVCVFLILTMALSLAIETVLLCTGFPRHASVTLGLGALLSLCALKGSQGRPRWRF
jgi:hypothetical protein